MKMINGKDSSGNKAWIMVDKKGNSIHVISSEEGSAVVFTAKQAKELIAAIRECISEQ